MRVFVILMVCGWSAVATAAPTWSEPWKIFPWGSGIGQFGLWSGVAEAVPEGPTAIAVEGDRIYVADDVNRRIVVLTAAGDASRMITSGKRVAALDASADGSVVLLSAALDQWALVPPDASVARFQPIESRPTFADGWRAVDLDPTLGPVVISSEGSAMTLTKGSTIHPKTATPLGHNTQGIGKWLTPHSAVVQVWPAHTPAASGQSDGHPPKEILIHTQRRLGMVRPVRVDAQGRLYVWLETLSNDAPITVTAEVRRFEPNGVESGRISWLVDDLAPANRYLDVDTTGTLYVMAQRPTGLAVWRLGATQWEDIQ